MTDREHYSDEDAEHWQSVKPATEEEVRQFIETYENAGPKIEKEWRNEKISATPLHPTTQEVSKFVRFAGKYPVYQTPSGKEFYLKRGEPQIFNKTESED